MEIHKHAPKEMQRVCLLGGRRVSDVAALLHCICIAPSLPPPPSYSERTSRRLHGRPCFRRVDHGLAGNGRVLWPEVASGQYPSAPGLCLYLDNGLPAAHTWNGHDMV